MHRKLLLARRNWAQAHNLSSQNISPDNAGNKTQSKGAACATVKKV
jgi:hypothetical protein